MVAAEPMVSDVDVTEDAVKDEFSIMGLDDDMTASTNDSDNPTDDDAALVANDTNEDQKEVA